MNPFNPQTLSFKIGDKVTWKEPDGSLGTGLVTNVHYSYLQVLQDLEEFEISYDQVLSNTP